jgi:hypothetical protein
VSSTPAGATVLLDGTNRGTSPVTLTDLSAGDHTLVLKMNGYLDYSTKVTVSTGSTATVTATLSPSIGSLSIKSSPSGAAIYLDGTSRGITPNTITSVPTGDHTLVLKMIGYQNYSTKVTVSAGKTSSISATLKRGNKK